MSKSLMLPAPPVVKPKNPPPGPLRRVNPEVLFSMDALRRAWIKVKAVGGAAGEDGETVERFETDLETNLLALRSELLKGRYRPRRVLRVFIPKPGGDLRPLGLWSVRDKIVQRVVYDCIEPYFEREFLDCSYGFRPGRGIADVVTAVIAHREAHRRWVADIDIKKCFDNLDPTLLRRFVRRQVRDPLILKLVQAWLRARVFNALSGPDTLAGASQGAVISPLLANVYLHHLDVQLVRRGFHVVRYADDLLILERRKQRAEHAMQAAATALKRIKLEINPFKSRLVHFDEGFQFVGVFFVKNRHYYL
ncbi:MAG: hypothetical protein D6706_11625 [Chloroflexi bacterium]|nr:MAG: hypothetical protein D6706_11625 [Chloroflexota bacterium]